jgi:hypothetical protein
MGRSQTHDRPERSGPRLHDNRASSRVGETKAATVKHQAAWLHW